MILGDICADSAFIIRILVKVLKILRWVIPILLILLITFDLFKVVTSNADHKTKKDATSKAAKRLIYAIIVFLVPTIIYFVFNSLDNLISPSQDTNGTPTTWFACWKKIYDDSSYGTKYVKGGYVKPSSTPYNGPYYGVSPSPVLPRPSIKNSYAYSPTYENFRSTNPVSTSKAVKWTGGLINAWGYYVGIRVEYDENTTHLAYAGASSIAELENLTYDYFFTNCAVGYDQDGVAIAKIEENSSSTCTRAVNTIERNGGYGTNSLYYNYKQSDYNFAFDLDELDVMDKTKKQDYYVAVWAVGQDKQMSNPVIYRITTDGTSNQDNWVMNRVR